MTIRDTLTYDYLDRFFDPGSLGRAQGYVSALTDVRIDQDTEHSLTATARVRGTAPLPYEVELHAEVDYERDWVFSYCTCPVARLCKHGAALALLVGSDPGSDRYQPGRRPDHLLWDQSQPGRPEPEAWREALARVSAELTRHSAEVLEGAPLALELSRRAPTRWSRSLTAGFTLRPKRPGKRGGWVKTGAEWTDLASRGTGRFDPVQAAPVRALYQSLRRDLGYVVVGHEPALEDFGDDLVWLLLDAVDAGVTLLAGEGVTSVTVAPEPAQVHGALTAEDGRTRLEVVADVGERRARGTAVVLLGRPALTLLLVEGQDVVIARAAAPVTDAVRSLLLEPPLVVPAEQSADFLSALAPLAAHLHVASPDASVVVPEPPRPRLDLTVTWLASTRAMLTWAWTYGSASCPPGSTDPLAGVRDTAAEAAIVSGLPAHLAASLERHTELTGGDALALALHDLPHLASLPDVEVREEARPEFRESREAPEITFDLAEAQPAHNDWLDLDVGVAVEGEAVPLPDVLAAITLGEEYLVLPSGLFVSLDRPEFARLHEAVAAAAQLREPQEKRISVGTSDFAMWNELAEVGAVDARAAVWTERAAALRDLAELPRPDPVGLTSTLRPYQQEGFWWLSFLYSHGLGGVLADDMGLGKTLQVLALIQYAVAGGADRPFLVVAPTSVVTAWRHEAARHAPSLRLGVVSRRADDIDAIASASDVVVTTYALLRLESERLAARPWAGLILDEAQQVKNHQSKAYAAARRIDAPFRLAVTGTPFENRLMELWALLSIAAPGLYPSPRRFREVVVGPVEKQSDDAALARFQRRIRPFLLRRTKDLVAAELPPKQEQVLQIDLEPRHRRIYDTHLAKERQRILGLVEDFGANRVAIFSALTKLRQLALDPALVDPAHAAVGSAKIGALVEHLHEITAEGHRALVFSQFTSFLGRVRERLTMEGVATTYLDGGTRDRDAPVQAFRDGEAPVFLISLKAGGTGLTLTEADYVFVLDPWWNPAAEAQAIDRAHRIGQDKHVHVYRLVASDTIEEKVVALKERKAELFARVIDGGGASAGGITAEDIRGLFED